jgi:hypothetical protein
MAFCFHFIPNVCDPELPLKNLKKIIGEFDVKLNFSDGMMASERRRSAVLA